MQKYIFKKYNSEYQRFFVSEKKKIVKILDLTANIEHIGSTAVPNLGGKGILDIIVGVSKLKVVEAKKKLEENSYQFCEKASYPERLFFKIDYLCKNKERRVHLHLIEFNGQEWKKIISFRDYLLKYPDAVRQYTKIKKEGGETSSWRW